MSTKQTPKPVFTVIPHANHYSATIREDFVSPSGVPHSVFHKIEFTTALSKFEFMQALKSKKVRIA